MIDKINTILSRDFEEIVNSSISLILLEVYSKYYLNGGQPRTCRQSQLEYYNTILRDKDKLTTIMEKTNICKLKGLKYIPKPLCKHYDLENLSDVDAAMLIEKGWLKESDFKELPKQYIEEKEIIKQIKKEEKEAKKAKSKKTE